MKTLILMITTILFTGNGLSETQAQGKDTPLAKSECPKAAFLILEQGKLAAVDWVEHDGRRVHTRTILTQSMVIDATIDLRPDETAAHTSVVVTMAGEKPGEPTQRDSGQGAIYLSDMIPSSVEQAVARARVVGGRMEHVTGKSLFSASVTDMLVERIDDTDWMVKFRNKNYRVLTDAQGCMVSASLPEYGVVIERRTDFSPEEYPLWPAYAAPPDGAYTASDAKIPAPQGHVLAGTLTKPKTGKLLPAAVLITGLSPAERNGGRPPWMPLRDLSDALTRAGIAVLRVDDRGVGQSTGDHAPSTTFDEADDVRTEVAWLRAQPGIDPKKIVLVGYSEGALIAAIVAAKDPAIAAIVSLDGTGVPGPQLAREQTEVSVLHDPSIAAADREKEVEKELAEPMTPREKSFVSIDPLEFARAVHCPALVLQGGTDVTVPVRSAEKLAEAMRSNGNRDVTVRFVPAVSHSMLPDLEGPGSGWLYLPAFATSPQVLELMTGWTAARLKAEGAVGRR